VNVSTAYYILKNESAPEWSEITMDQLKAIADGGAFELKAGEEGGWVLFDGSDYLHVGVTKDGNVVSFERFGGNNPDTILDAIEGALGPDQFIVDEHNEITQTLMEAEFNNEEEPAAEPDLTVTDDDKKALKQLGIQGSGEPPVEEKPPLGPDATPDEIGTRIYDDVTIQLFQDYPRQEISTGDDDADFLTENETYADKIYDETMQALYGPEDEYVEEYIEKNWPAQAEAIRGIIYEHIFAGIT